MHDPVQLIGRAKAVLGSEEVVLAAGIFGLKDDYVVAGVAAAGGASLGGALLDNRLAGGVGGAAAPHASRAARAASQGLTAQMLIVVSSEDIRVLDWVTGSGPTRVLRRFDRSSTEVTITKFGLSRHVEIRDPATDQSLALTGSTAPFSSASKGDKAVLKVLSH
jgi:hypothetical protein